MARKKPRKLLLTPDGRLAFLCTEEGCDRPFAYIDAGGLTIQSHHGKEKDVNVVSLVELEVFIELVKCEK